MSEPPAEIVNPSVRRGTFRAVLFDFDGTLSLIREGWPRVMVSMMVERLREQNLADESEGKLGLYLERMVMAHNGEPTIRQMEALVRDIQRRGGVAGDPWDYLRDYVERLMQVVRGRWEALESGRARPDEWVVPRVHALLANLRARNMPLFLASGTDYDHVAHEARLLEVSEFFPEGINAPKNNDPAFRKANVIARILEEHHLRGEELLAFGDGVVETREVKRVGGVAVGVASSEYGSGLGAVNASKRETLIAAGADLIIPDYVHHDELIGWLQNERR